MKHDEFRKLVQKMRTAQKKYYKSPMNSTEKQDLLRASKKLERQVDEQLAGGGQATMTFTDVTC